MYDYYQGELQTLAKSNRIRKRKIFPDNLLDLASNDYLGIASNKMLSQKAIIRFSNQTIFSPKASALVNGYSKTHQKFEKRLAKINGFEKGIIVGSGFLANISLIESMVRKKDILFIDEEYHASGILATKLPQGEVVVFKHNDTSDLKDKINTYAINKKRVLIAIEGVYSMGGDIAPKEIYNIAKEYNAILIVDEAHSSGVIGENLLGWFDYFNLKIEKNHIKMGTLGKAYGSYGAYILASSHIIKFLENRAKPIIYSTALSLFDTIQGDENFKYIQKNKLLLKKKIKKKQQLVKNYLGINPQSLIIPIVINDNKKVLQIQEYLLKQGFIVGAIRQPTVKQAILRVIIKLDISDKYLIKLLQLIQEQLNG